MKTWGSIEEAAKDLGITTRSVYRQIENGKISKQRGKGGGWIYVKNEVEGVSDDDVTVTPTDDIKDGVNDFIDSKDVIKRRPPKEATGDIIAPTTFPPDEEMISERKQTFIAEQRERRARAQRSEKEMMGDVEDPFVLERRAAFQGKKFFLEEYKIDKELRVLQAEDREEEKRQERRSMIERIKMNVVPPSLRQELPPDICLLTLNHISLELSKLDISLLTEDEVLTFAIVVRNKFWQDPQINGTVRYALIRSLFRDLDMQMHRRWREWKEENIQRVCLTFEEQGVSPEMVRSILEKNHRFSYDEYLCQFFQEFMITDPDGCASLFQSIVELNCLLGNRPKIEKTLNEMGEACLAMLSLSCGQGGDLLS